MLLELYHVPLMLGPASAHSSSSLSLLPLQSLQHASSESTPLARLGIISGGALLIQVSDAASSSLAQSTELSEHETDADEPSASSHRVDPSTACVRALFDVWRFAVQVEFQPLRTSLMIMQSLDALRCSETLRFSITTA